MPEGRAYVATSPGRSSSRAAFRQLLTYGDGEYNQAFRFLFEPVVLVHWDLALEPDDVEAFERAIAQSPDEVHVAPFRLWPFSTGLDRPVWAHRHADLSWIRDGDERAELVSFGCIYLPKRALEVARSCDIWCASVEHVEETISFSRAWGAGGRVCWDCRPKHLNW